ncbi:MAG: hypothetical protein QNJ16_10750 [Rhodobacter sp.]|nr:hypothetical protein [Rhodobacter sp.]
MGRDPLVLAISLHLVFAATVRSAADRNRLTDPGARRTVAIAVVVFGVVAAGKRVLGSRLPDWDGRRTHRDSVRNACTALTGLGLNDAGIAGGTDWI